MKKLIILTVMSFCAVAFAAETRVVCKSKPNSEISDVTIQKTASGYEINAVLSLNGCAEMQDCVFTTGGSVADPVLCTNIVPEKDKSLYHARIFSITHDKNSNGYIANCEEMYLKDGGERYTNSGFYVQYCSPE